MLTFWKKNSHTAIFNVCIFNIYLYVNTYKYKVRINCNSFLSVDSLLSIYNENMYQFLTNLLWARKQSKQSRLCRHEHSNDPSWLSNWTFIFTLEMKRRYYIMIFTPSWSSKWMKIGSAKSSEWVSYSISKRCLQDIHRFYIK